MSWQIEFRNGVRLPQVDWWLDAHFPVARSFVSHAHSDHIAAHREILCTAVTARLMRERLPGRRREHVLPFGHTEALTPGCAVTLHPAGHIFGSAQSLLEHDTHGSLLYTGDFKLRPGLTAEPCATPHADVLIMETTFGLPRYVFPPAAQVLADIAHFCHETIADGATPVLFGYSLGKSQELLSGLAGARLPVMLTAPACRLTEVYEERGIAFPPYRELAPEDAAGHVVICPPQSRGSELLRGLGPCRTAMISGWAVDPGAIHRYQCKAVFPLSDHADFPDLLRFVEAVNPRRVFTLHGFAREFAQTLRERGIEAWALGADNQLEFAIGQSGRLRPAAPVSEPPAPTAAVASAAPDSFARFVTIADTVRSTTGRREKIAVLRDYIGSLPVDSVGCAARFLSGRALSASDPHAPALGWNFVRRAVLAAAGLSEADYRASYQVSTDASAATAAMLAAGFARTGELGGTATLGDVAGFLDRTAAARGPAAKIDVLRAGFADLAPVEAGRLVGLLTGDPRTSLKQDLIVESVAIAAGQPIERVSEAVLLCGDIGAVARAAFADRLADIALTPFHPLRFGSPGSEPAADAGLARGNASESTATTRDSRRCQLHKIGRRVELYASDLRRITDQFPELVRAAAALPADFIGDGELCPGCGDLGRPFAALPLFSRDEGGDDFRLGAEPPMSLSFHDILWLDGRSLLHDTAHARRETLLRTIPPGHARLSVALDRG